MSELGTNIFLMLRALYFTFLLITQRYSPNGTATSIYIVVLVLCNRIFCCIFGWYFYVKSGWNLKKIFCCPALELFHCLPLWTTVRLHGKKLQNATKNVVAFVLNQLKVKWVLLWFDIDFSCSPHEIASPPRQLFLACRDFAHNNSNCLLIQATTLKHRAERWTEV